jgi:hypothetical protein
MPELRPVISFILKLSFVSLVVVLMILWIVLGAQTVNEITDLDTETKRLNQQDRNKYYDKRPFDRVKGMTIFNTLLEEVIALLAILGILFSQRYLLQTSFLLLAIIWFVAHYRISDLFWYGSQVMIASHIIHFIVVCIGLVFANFVKDNNPNEKSTKIKNDSTA